MQRSPFIDVIVRSCVAAHNRLRIQPVHPPGTLAPKQRGFHQRPEGWPTEDCANEPFGILRRAATVVFFVLAIAMCGPAAAGVRAVGPIELTVGDVDKETRFFTNVLPFTMVREWRTPRGADDDLLNLRHSELRSVELQLADERVILTEHVGPKGRPIPEDSRSFDHWFQHIAIVVSDMERAYERLRAHKVKHVSTAPQTLPGWNEAAGGIKAFYFRDPEDHVLEIIWFPAEKGDARWHKTTTNLFLGIDHTAIVVNDTDKSLHFYTNHLGLRIAGKAENHGTEQEHLNQIFGARLRITALRAEAGPGIELLEYLAPPGGRRLPRDARANDLIFWQTWLGSDTPAAIIEELQEKETVFVSRRASAAAEAIVRDPDGHALRIVNSGTHFRGERANLVTPPARP